MGQVVWVTEPLGVARKVPTSPVMFPSVQVTAALASTVKFDATAGGGGETTTVTTTVARPDTLPSRASTVLVNVPATVPAVNRPVLLMLPPFATTAQVGEIETMLPLASWPTAANCCVALAAKVSELGVTVMEAAVMGAGASVTAVTAVPVIVTSAFDETFPCRLPPVSVMPAPARMLPWMLEVVIVTASATRHVTLDARAPPAITTEKPVPVRAPVPLVPIFRTQIPSAGPLSVNTPVTVAAALKQ